ncbi:Mov34/MPN/PAD-1 family protein [Aeromonas rivipollensis]|uniref:Mov34/MPN/PAD-1 family protein n=1 Tax=Aeromonas rivipollensis TaxID=948519 RepID=UPI000FB669C3
MSYMLPMSSWTTEDNRTLLHFSESVLRTFCQHIQVSEFDYEAGGILLGSVHGAHLLIEQATVPTTWDKRFRYQFERMPAEHEAVAQSRWMASQGTVRYLGEWHTHPEDHPRPSGLDISEWRQLSAQRRDNRPILAVIVGRYSLHVELAHSSGDAQVLFPIS